MKTALQYAQETLKMYSDKSTLNPMNRQNRLYFESEIKEWDKRFNEMKIVVYLETILERLPYEVKNEE